MHLCFLLIIVKFVFQTWTNLGPDELRELARTLVSLRLAQLFIRANTEILLRSFLVQAGLKKTLILKTKFREVWRVF